MKKPVETKTIAATGGAVGGAGVLGTLLLWTYGAWLGGAGWDASNVEKALASVPGPVSAAILSVAGGLVAFVSGYLAPHTFRADLVPDEPDEGYEPEHAAPGVR